MRCDKVHQLGGVSCVHVPSNSDHRTGTSEATTAQVRHGPAGPSVAEATVVSHASGVAGEPSSQAATVSSASRAAEVIAVSPESEGLPASCLEIVWQSHRDKGFS